MNRLDISVKEVLGRAGLIFDDSSKVVVIENIKFEFNEHISDAFINALTWYDSIEEMLAECCESFFFGSVKEFNERLNAELFLREQLINILANKVNKAVDDRSLDLVVPVRNDQGYICSIYIQQYFEEEWHSLVIGDDTLKLLGIAK